MGITTIRTVYLLRDYEIAKRVPEEVKSTVARLFTVGAATFALGFFVWNLDNVFCGTITRWKHVLGWPAAFILEGNAPAFDLIMHSCSRSSTSRPLLVAHPHCSCAIMDSSVH